MSLPAEGPMFAPDFFEIGSECLWRHAYEPPLSMNAWFIAGPGAGVERADWIQAAQAWRKQVLAGKGRYLAVNTASAGGWLRLAGPLAEALSLQAGDDLFLAVNARSPEGPARIDLMLEDLEKDGDIGGPIGSLNISAGEAWQELSISAKVPDTGSGPHRVRPKLVAHAAEPDTAPTVELAGVILGIDDAARMDLLGQALRAMDTTHVCRCVYDREDLAWTASAFGCYFLFAYDQRFWRPDTGYQVDAFMEEMRRRFGGVETVVLWPAYPRIGVDDRNQFDFFRDLPGGLEGVKEVCRKFHEHGVRVQIPLLPWDTGTRREDRPDAAIAAELVAQLEADGVFLDTLTGATPALRRTVDAQRPGVALIPELCPSVRQLSLCNLSWAQWAHDPEPPGMPLLKWLEPRHLQYFTRRWERSHRDEIETAFFNGTGLLLWENIFGAHNPVSPEDALLWKRCASILRAYPEVFVSNLWDPFYPSLHDEVSIHRWPGAPTTLFTLRNLGEPIIHGPLLRWQFPEHSRADNMEIHDVWSGRPIRWEMTAFGTVQVWGDLDRLGCIAVSFGKDPHLETFLAEQANLATQKEAFTDETPAFPALKPVQVTKSADGAVEGMAHIAGGVQRMQIRHPRRECGCYPDPGAEEERRRDFIWGTPHEEIVEHDYTVTLADFLIDEAQVSNAEFERFLKATGYQPEHPENFLRHWPDGVMPEDIADLPVVYVDLDDARAYARWAGKRLPTEPEWQRAAQGDDGRAWPWGNDFDPAKCASAASGPLPVRSLPEGRGPNGLYHTSGNVWEWTESEYDDGHTRFCIIRGGSWYQPSGSGWYVPGGPQSLNTHTKFLLLWPGLDRCATVGFRCVKDDTDCK